MEGALRPFPFFDEHNAVFLTANNIMYDFLKISTPHVKKNLQKLKFF